MHKYFPNQNIYRFLSFLFSEVITMENNVDASDVDYIVWKERVRFHDLYLKTAEWTEPVICGGQTSDVPSTGKGHDPFACGR